MAALSLDHHLCFALYSASRAMTAAYRPILTELNLTYPQYLVLLALWEERQATVGRLGERLQLDSGTLSPLLKRLEANGFIRRERSATDERLVEITLTPAGRLLESKAQCIPEQLFSSTGYDRARSRGPARRGPSPHRCTQRITTKGIRMKTLYTAEALTTGEGRDGKGRSSDGKLDLDLAIPKEMGGSGNGTNPEQLFAVGYAACFHSALRLVGRQEKADVSDSAVGARVSLGQIDNGGFGLAVELEVTLPNLDKDAAQQLAEKAHQVCPYSNATRGNIDVKLVVTDD